MSKSVRFPYISVGQLSASLEWMPFLPLKLSRGIDTEDVFGLVDSGASVSVLPYQIGLKLGAIWENQMPLFRLGGNLANYESRGLVLKVKIGDFQSIKLAFAWTKAENVPVILGQTNFFSIFDICFHLQDKQFELKMR